MKKYIVVLLYVLLILTLAGGLSAVFFHLASKETSDKAVSTGNTETVKSTELSGDVAESGNTEKAGDAQGNGTSVDVDNASMSDGTEGTETAGNTSGSEEETEGAVTLMFAGDVMLDGVPSANYDAYGITGVVSQELLDELTGADILMVNNEFAWSDRGTAMEDKEYTYRCNPSYVTILKELGVDIVSLANNHTLDFGKEALSDTFTTLDGAGILYAGAGESKERAEQVQVIEKGGKKFGFIAGSRVIPVTDWNVENAQPGLFTVYDYSRLVELVAQAKESCDFVTVYLHWGIERVEYPEEYERAMAKACIEAGADLIIGGHAHCIQGVEFIENVPVFYALGDFIFLRQTSHSAVVSVTVEADGTVSYRYLPTYTSGGVTQLLDEAGTQETYRYVEGISWGMTIGEDGTIQP